jgi:hypothetical protein
MLCPAIAEYDKYHQSSLGRNAYISKVSISNAILSEPEYHRGSNGKDKRIMTPHDPNFSRLKGQ